MRIVDVASIRVGENRQRRTFSEEKLAKLRDSITRLGLLHPPVVSTDASGGYELRSGERRLRAILSITTPFRHGNDVIPPGQVPITLWDELTELEKEEIEYEENAIRDDLPWAERVAAEAKLHRLREAQAKLRGETQTYTATVEELKGGTAPTQAITSLRENVMLEPFLNDPDVLRAGTRQEAVNIAKKKLRDTFSASLAARLNIAKLKTPHNLLNGSCIELLPTFPSEIFDVVLADPPYGINAHKMDPMSKSQSGVLHEYIDTPEAAREVWNAILVEGYRVAKREAHLYMFCDITHWPVLGVLAQRAGWDPWPRPIVWHKPGGGMLGDSTRGPRRSYELIFYARKGDKKVRGVYIDTIVANPVSAVEHAAAKPVEVYENLLRRSVIPGDRVLDPCCGSGPIFPAATTLSCFATGIEVVETHYATALRRLT